LLEERPDIEASFLDSVIANGEVELITVINGDLTRAAELVRAYATAITSAEGCTDHQAKTITGFNPDASSVSYIADWSTRHPDAIENTAARDLAAVDTIAGAIGLDQGAATTASHD
jgi:hypothetical protein